MTDRQRQLIAAEALRHERMATATDSETMKRDQMEVAEALRAALSEEGSGATRQHRSWAHRIALRLRPYTPRRLASAEKAATEK